MAFERSSFADTADFTEGILKYDCLCNEFSKDYKYTRMNCWTNVADKLDMTRLFIVLSDHSDQMETGRSLRSPN